MDSLNYIGSKKTLLPTILQIIDQNIDVPLDQLTFGDLFSGTGIIAFTMKHKCKKVIANDLEYYSYIICRSLLSIEYTQSIQQQIDKLNSDPNLQCEGLISNTYSPLGGRLFFTEENAKRIDYIRQSIGDDPFIVASLIVSSDKIANTTSVYGAFLKRFKPSAIAPIKLHPIHTDPLPSASSPEIYNLPAETLTNELKDLDIIYLDPPYNHRQYGSNYFPLNVIARYQPTTFAGKTGIPTDYRTQSKFCSKRQCLSTFRQLLSNIKNYATHCKYLLISYNNEGILQYDDIIKETSSILSPIKIIVTTIKYSRYSSIASASKKVKEYLFLATLF